MRRGIGLAGLLQLPCDFRGNLFLAVSTAKLALAYTFAELVCRQRGLGAANANLRNGDLCVGLTSSVCSESLAAMIGHARRVSRHVTVKIVTLHALLTLPRVGLASGLRDAYLRASVLASGL